MATVRDIITRALRRPNILDSTEQPSGDDAQNGLDALNDIMHGWASDGFDPLHEDFALSDTFRFFVPPKAEFGRGAFSGLAEGRLGVSLNRISYQGGWDANANTPALSSGTGTQGLTYKVSTAGTTTLDRVTSWAAGDYVLYDGKEWIKAPATGSRALEGHVVAILGVRLCEDYGMPPGSVLVRDAERGIDAIRSHWMIPSTAQWDTGLSRMPSQRYTDYFNIQE